jgi:hypothetical protein
VGGSDVRGRFYARQAGRRATAKGIIQEDSVPIERWDPYTTRRDTVAFYRPTGRLGLVASLENPPFPAVISWAVASDGRVAVVYPGDYHVEFIDPLRGRTVGKPIPWTRVRLSKAHKQEWWKEQGPVCASSVARSGVVAVPTPEGGVAFGKVIPRREPKEWPEYLPPFNRFAASFAPDGTLWVRRTGATDELQAYDLIDGNGRVVRRVVMEPRSKLLGFGKSAVYTVNMNDDDLQFVQRHKLPVP